MNKFKVLIILICAFALNACGDDNGHGDHADIRKAKELVKTFNDSTVLRKGYIQAQNTQQVMQTLRRLSRSESAYYQMHQIGCINEDGSKDLITNELHTTAELIIGVTDHKARYVQTNRPGRCYFGGGYLSGNIGWQRIQKKFQFGKIPKDICQTLSAQNVLRRVDKDDLDEVYPGYAFNRSSDYYGDPNANRNWNNENYWDWQRPDPQYNHHRKEEDSYFKVSVFAQTSQLSYYSPAVEDRFDSLSGDRAVFVSKGLDSRSCYKSVYYGQRIDPNRSIPVEFFLVRPDAD